MTDFRRRCFALETLEPRLCLSTSLGWDGAGQGSASLSYHVGSIPDSLGGVPVEATLEAALDVWSDVADIHFEQTARSGRPDSLDFRFGNIDGPGGILAQAYLPDDLNRNPTAGDIQFDVSESWESGNRRGGAAFDLMLVAVHEIGHALGLDHAHSADSIMRAAVSAYDQFSGLAASDIDAILHLYAPADAPPADNVAPAPPSAEPSMPVGDPVATPVDPSDPLAPPPTTTPGGTADQPTKPDAPPDNESIPERDPDSSPFGRFGWRWKWHQVPRAADDNFGPFFRPRFGRFPGIIIVGRIDPELIGRIAPDLEIAPSPEARTAEPSDSAVSGGTEENTGAAEKEHESDSQQDRQGRRTESRPHHVPRTRAQLSALRSGRYSFAGFDRKLANCGQCQR